MTKTKYKHLHHRYRHALRAALAADDAGDNELCENLKDEFQEIERQWPFCILLNRSFEPPMSLKMRADYHAQIPF